METGTIQTMQVTEIKDRKYILTKGMVKISLPFSEATEKLNIGDTVEVFIFKDFATMNLPTVTIGTFAWVTVCMQEKSSLYADIGTSKPIIIPENDLPHLRSVWPKVGDRLYVTLKRKRNGDLFAVPAKEKHFSHLFTSAHDIELNDKVSGTVIRTAREGTVIITDEGYRGFIHYTEREFEPRLGERVTGRVIEVKADGTLNVSLKPLKHERIDDDANVILQVLKENGGVMNFSDQSDPNEIKTTFHMSKAAFKRALGRLMKKQLIEQRERKTYLINRKDFSIKKKNL